MWNELDGTRTYYLYAEEGLIAEADGSGTVTRQYGWRPDGLWGTDPLYLKQAGQSYYYHNDHLGTPQKLVSVTGQVVWEARYAAFGEAQAAGTIENPLRFPGQYYDVETGMHYNYFRYYDPSTGRYVSSDPIGLKDGINVYEYVTSNPVNHIDPFGLSKMRTNSQQRNRNNPNGPRPSINETPKHWAELFVQIAETIDGPGIPQTDEYCTLVYCPSDDSGGVCRPDFPGVYYRVSVRMTVFFASSVSRQCLCISSEFRLTGEIR